MLVKENLSIDGLTLFFDSDEHETAALIRPACEKSARLLQARWGLTPPEDCRIYVMTAWQHFVFHAAPWPWRVLLTATFPLWAFRARQTWALAGGWAQQFGRRRAIGVKPSRLIRAADRSIGARIFVQEADIQEKIQHIACHELTHAFTHHLKLPIWLHEGLAMVAVDTFCERPTVQRQTLALLVQTAQHVDPGRYPRVQARSADALIQLYAQGYWATRYLAETQPELLPRLLAQRRSHAALEDEIATALQLAPTAFWQELNGVVVAHFEGQGRQ